MLKTIVFITGLLHFCQVPALLFAPKMLNWREEYARLSPINWRIFQVIGGGITLAILGLGIVVMAAPSELISGGRLGMGLSLFLSVWWAYRFAVQVLLYGRLWPGGLLGRLSYFGLNLLLFYLSAAYMVFFVVGFHR